MLGHYTTPPRYRSILYHVFRRRARAGWFLRGHARDYDAAYDPYGTRTGLCGKQHSDPRGSPCEMLSGGSDGIRTRDLSLDRAAC